MSKRIFSIGLVLVLLFLLGSCQNGGGNNLTAETIVASSSASGNVSAAKGYAKNIGAQHVEFSSDSDAVVAVLSGKADYVVLDEYTGFTFSKENKSIQFYEKCDYCIEYRASFSFDDGELCDEFNEAFDKLTKDGAIDKIKLAVNNKEEYIPEISTVNNGALVMLCDPIYDNRLYYGDDGEPTGVDFYIAQEVCNCLGYKLIVKTVNAEDLFEALDAGEGDFIMSCIERTDQRADHYLFSNVYATYDYNVYKIK